jgi:hypothetical protein
VLLILRFEPTCIFSIVSNYIQLLASASSPWILTFDDLTVPTPLLHFWKICRQLRRL